ncbi:hypothetical protein JL09_g6500, partial [Pichia kudriavzevii]
PVLPIESVAGGAYFRI